MSGRRQTFIEPDLKPGPIKASCDFSEIDSMSSLLRYKKQGGFLQLLSLIETFAPQKKDKFLEMIEGESVAWADALKAHMLTIERIFSWPDQTMIEVFKHLPIKTLAYALEGITPEQKARVLTYFSASEKRRLDDTVVESSPKAAEVAAVLVKVVEQARKMLLERVLHPDKFDASLIIPEDIESQLEASELAFKTPAANKAPQPIKPAAAASGEPEAAPVQQASGDVIQLQRTLGLMAKENKALKEEVRVLREKLDQIKKLSAA